MVFQRVNISQTHDYIRSIYVCSIKLDKNCVSLVSFLEQSGLSLFQAPFIHLSQISEYIALIYHFPSPYFVLSEPVGIAYFRMQFIKYELTLDSPGYTVQLMVPIFDRNSEHVARA